MHLNSPASLLVFDPSMESHEQDETQTGHGLLKAELIIRERPAASSV